MNDYFSQESHIQRISALIRIIKGAISVSYVELEIHKDKNTCFGDSNGCFHLILGQNDSPILIGNKEARAQLNHSIIQDHTRLSFFKSFTISNQRGEQIGSLHIGNRRKVSLSSAQISQIDDILLITESLLTSMRAATSDELTGLLNRRGFYAMSSQILSQAQRKALSVGVMYFDLNGFKEINDSYGHAEGDRALQAFSEAMKKTFRTGDAIARVGGDEFIALMCDCEAKDCKSITRRLHANLTSYIDKSELAFCMDFACGFVIAKPSESVNLSEMIYQADKLMLQDKPLRACHI